MPNTLLDIDKSTLEKSLLLENKNELTELLKSFEKPKTPFVLVRPMPGVCLKMRTESGEKGFINICHTNEIPAPEDISEDKLVEAMTSEEPSFVIPMSIGQERLDPDKGGSLCKTYDVAINTEFFNKCQGNKIFMLFASQIMVEAINNKFNQAYNDESCLILKNRKVMGTLQQHRIEKREVRKPQFPKKLIQEVGSTFESPKSAPVVETKNSKDKTNRDQKKAKHSDHLILQTPSKGKPKKLIGLFKVPILSPENITIDIGEDRIIVESVKANYFVDIFVPYSLNQEEVSAEMDSNLGILRLNLPVKC